MNDSLVAPEPLPRASRVPAEAASPTDEADDPEDDSTIAWYFDPASSPYAARDKNPPGREGDPPAPHWFTRTPLE